MMLFQKGHAGSRIVSASGYGPVQAVGANPFAVRDVTVSRVSPEMLYIKTYSEMNFNRQWIWEQGNFFYPGFLFPADISSDQIE